MIIKKEYSDMLESIYVEVDALKYRSHSEMLESIDQASQHILLLQQVVEGGLDAAESALKRLALFEAVSISIGKDRLLPNVIQRFARIKYRVSISKDEIEKLFATLKKRNE